MGCLTFETAVENKSLAAFSLLLKAVRCVGEAYEVSQAHIAQLINHKL